MLLIKLALSLILVMTHAVAFAGTGFTVLDSWESSGDKTADALIKTGAGMVHTVTCASDAAATAGTLAIRDGVAAGGGTIMQQIEFVAAFLPPVTMTLDQKFATGLYLDFTTTADVHCSVGYK